MRKILFISNADSIHTIKWVKALHQHYEILLFDWRPVTIQNYEGLQNVINISLDSGDSGGFRIKNYAKAFFSIRKIAKSFSPDLVHAHYASSYGILGVRAGYHPLVTSVWGTDITIYINKSWIHKQIIKFVLKMSDHIYATSHFLAQIVKRISGKECVVTPFGVKVTGRYKTRKKKDHFYFGIAKRIDQFSGIDLAIKCFAKLKERHPEKKLKFEIAGDGPLKKEMELIVLQLGLQNHVNFHGHIHHENIDNFLEKIDVYINLPEKESFGVAVLEASASGCPIIASDVEGLSEVIINGETGFLIDRKNENEIIDTMESFVMMRSKIDQMGNNGVKFVNEKYNWDNTVAMMLDHYQMVLRNDAV